MDKRVMFAVAGSGKTTHIVNALSRDKRSLIITYTDANYENLSKKILTKFDSVWPNNITLLTYFKFLYHFCYKPFLADRVKAKGILYIDNPNRYAKQDKPSYYLSDNRFFYSNRLSFFLEVMNAIGDVKDRIETYFDEFIIDEIQDIGGRDFNFLEKLMETNVNMLFVGDFFQHTYDTSHDGRVNTNLFSDFSSYCARFSSKGLTLDTKTLINSWRCSKSVCEYVSNNLGIAISSNRKKEDDTRIILVSDPSDVSKILQDPKIVKLHYQDSAKHGAGHRNWGDTKGEDCYADVCVLLNKTTAKLHSQKKLKELAPLTRNKLYVAITRAHGNVYIVYE